MADKLNDQEIASELKRFGETVKLPIDNKKRPILIKKLNHFYVRENPPQKKGKSPGRRSKTVVAPEFSDDSQEDSETETSQHKPIVGRRSRNNARTTDTSTSRTLRNRRIDNGNISNDGQNSFVEYSGKRKSYSTGQQVEIYPEEFSDNDTADESVYEVEEQSIGVNTSMAFNDTEDELPSFSTRSRNKSTHRISTPLTQSSPNAIRNNYNGRGKVFKQQQSANSPESDHFVSKTILTAVAIFFVVLAGCYVYIRRDILLPSQAAFEKSDLSKGQLCDEKTCFKKEEVDVALKVLSEVNSHLTSRKGKFELGEINEDEKQMKRTELVQWIEKGFTKQNVSRIADLVCRLIIKKGEEWHILPFKKSGETALRYEEIDAIESMFGDLSFIIRLQLAFYKVLYGLCLVLVCLFVGVLGIFYLRWVNNKKEKQQQKVYDMVEKIIEILQENSELAEKKGDEKKYPPYLAVQHIRDQIIPVSKRKAMQWLWDEAVKFIESNESRIRVETRMMEGEEFTVWRWLQAIPNGHKVWQGQAFGETSQKGLNSLPYGPTPCLKVRNMFDASMEQTTDDWHLDVEESILEKCKNNNGILHIFVDRTSKEGCVYIKCSSCEKAYEAYQALHGWWFDGRLVTVKYLRLEHYHDRFPDSRNRRFPLKPTNNEMQSLSRPFHKSALEMT